MANRAHSDDVIDSTGWKLGRWRVTRLADFDGGRAADERPTVRAPAPTPAELAEEVRRARARCDELAACIARVWAIEGVAEQARATDDLMAQAEAAGPTLVALEERSAVRLARLAVRHADALSNVDDDWFVFTWLTFGASPEVADLLHEVSAAGNGHLSDALVLALDRADLHRDYPMLGARLAQLVTPTSSFETRLVALGWLADGHWPAAVRAQRAALREPYLALRQAALAGLLHYDELTAADVLWLLEDAVRHPLASTRFDEVAFEYDANLTEAAARLAPHGGATPLLRVLTGECARPRDGLRTTLDFAWALRALAAGYPAVARPHVDRALAHTDSHRRYEGVAAAAQLPADDARPRLRTAALDPSPMVAKLARVAWEAIAHRALVIDELEGLPLALLDAPPLEVLRSRLLVLRGDALPPRLAMLEALLAAAPDPEALVLLAYALGDSALMWSTERRGLPLGKSAWSAAITERFGALGASAVTWLDERWPAPSVATPPAYVPEPDAASYWRDPPDDD